MSQRPAVLGPDGDVASVASSQHGLFSRAQVLHLGFDDDTIHRRLASGWWLKLAPGVYSLPGWPPSWRRSLMLAHLDVGPRSVVSHEAAAALHELATFTPGPVVLTVDHGDHQRTRHDVTVHQSTDPRECDRTVVGGLPVTTVARTLFDLAAVTRRPRFERALDYAHVSRRCAVGEVGAIYAERRRPGKRGMKRLGAVLAERGPGHVPPASVLERRLLKALSGGGLPDPRRPGHDRADTTWSMQAVRAATSSGSTAGYMPTRTWLRPSLR